MSPDPDITRIVGIAWPVVLEQLEDAVIVMDEKRLLRYMNGPARSLLGYDSDHVPEGRCRLTTRGLDCEHACPLTFAIEGDLEVVKDFAAVYRRRDGSQVALHVTVVPLRREDGSLSGAIEILRLAEPDAGFFLAGCSGATLKLRRRVQELAQTASHMYLIGEELACRDVARAVHRCSGLGDELFHSWLGCWEEAPTWPPGTMFASGDDALPAMEAAPQGWRVIIGVTHSETAHEAAAQGMEVLELPPMSALRDDLPLMVAAWVAEISPGLAVEPSALQKLCRLVGDRGFEGLQPVLATAIASAQGSLRERDIPTDGYGAGLVDEALQAEDPLGALEESLLREVLDRCGWRMLDAADRLGISRVTLWRKLKEHGICRPGSGE